MVSSAQCPELLHRFRTTVLNFRMKVAELGPARPLVRLVDRIAILVEPNGDRTLDLMSKLGHLAVENPAFEGRLYGHHSAADVDTDCGWNNSILGCDDRTNHRSDPKMCVRHQRDVLE